MNKNNKKGFTLAELLIVVAIIGVLVAVSIPIFTSQLQKARNATNASNVRAAKAAAVADYLTEAKTGVVTYTYTVSTGTIAVAGADLTADVVDTDKSKTKESIIVTITASGNTIYTNPALSSYVSDGEVAKN